MMMMMVQKCHHRLLVRMLQRPLLFQHGQFKYSSSSTLLFISTNTNNHCCFQTSRRPLSSSTTNSTTNSTTTTSSNTTTKAPQKTLLDRSLIKGPHGDYLSEYNESIKDPRSFWYDASKHLHWFKPPSKQNVLQQQKQQNVLQQQKQQEHNCNSSNHHHDHDHDHHPGLIQWFADGQINMSYNCLDRHVQNKSNYSANNKHIKDNIALIYDSPLTHTKQTYTYQQLLNHVSKFAYALKHDFDIQVGDRVIIYMPMIPQAVIAMLACARIGAVHSVVFGGFASPELASRIIDCKPKLVISANGGIEPNDKIVDYKKLLDDALDIVLSHHDNHDNHDDDNDHDNHDNDNGTYDIKSIIVRRNAVNDGQCTMIHGRDTCYDEIMKQTTNYIDAIPLPSTHPNYILYTSGTTGKPKGVVRDTGSHATALNYSMSAFYDTHPGEVFFAASDIGWVVGHSYIVYAPLLRGCTTVLYEGKPVGTPDAGALWRIVEEYNVKTLFTAPTAIRAIKQVDPKGEFVKNYDLSSFKTLFLAGERTDPETLRYCERILCEYDIPAIDHWWQTELGWPAIGNAIGLGRIPTKYGACASPVPGFNLDVFDNEGQPVPNGMLGNLAIKTPLPPGALVGLYNNNKRYIKDYLLPLDGYYMTGDSAIIDEEGYVHIMSRTDDIINTAGHRLSTGAIEEILLSHPEVGDCAVIGINDNLKGQIPIGFVVLNANSTVDHDELCQDLVLRVRHVLGPVASFKKIAVVQKLPKTRSGKILRGTMVKIANEEDWIMTPTIEDPTVFDSLIPHIKRLSSTST